MSDFVVGLTGGIGSGKSAVSDRFGALGIDIVDADIASRVVVEPGRSALQEIETHFGSSVIQSDGGLDRAALRKLIFADDAERLWLESLLHPLINEEIRLGLKNASSVYVILASPLLIETEQHRLTQRILVVDVPVETQVQRTMARDNNSEEQVRNIINAQSSRETRLSMADDIVDNDRGLDALDKVVRDLHENYLSQAKSFGKNAS